MVIRDFGQMDLLRRASLRTQQWDSTETSWQQHWESHPLKTHSAILEIHCPKTIKMKKKKRYKKKQTQKAKWLEAKSHVDEITHTHTSLHLSGHAKNSPTARSVALANISVENAAACGFQALWKMYARIPEPLRNIKAVFCRVSTHSRPTNQQLKLKSHWKGTLISINAAPGLLPKI